MARVEVPAWLEEVADRDLYRRNAFRISGLAVTATLRAVRRRVSEVRAAETLETDGFIGAWERRMLWEQAYRHWHMVLADDGCWRWLDERIHVLDDPRLRAVSGTALREALPAALLEIHAGIAVDAAQRQGDEARA
ncbi:hypothetical protein [Nonomuraea sp. B19D2]|uniref:hypothetical protein n=1 Tax=Nonomuraea sp. B19D2 TaxID=3159561 RepID=UPI0032DA365E